MIGRLRPNTHQSVVIGAGISGLIAAYRLVKKGHSVEIFESSSRPGGLIQTLRISDQERSFLAETAAHSFLATPTVIELCKELGVELTEVQPKSKARYIFRLGHARRFPLKLVELLELLVRVFLCRFRKNQNLKQWGDHHLGQAGTRYLLNPFLRGIYAARPEDLLVSMTFPRLTGPIGHSLVSRFIAERITRRLPRPPKKPKSRMMAPTQGMESLVQALTRFLSDTGKCRFIFGQHITSDRFKEWNEKNVIFALPPHSLSRIMGEIEPNLAAALNQVRMAKLVTVTVIAKNTDFSLAAGFRQPPKGVGILIPESEVDRKCLGILFNSSAFKHRVSDESQISSYTMMFSELSIESESEIIEAEFRAITGYTGELQKKITRWNEALPIYGPDLKMAWDKFEEYSQRRPGHIWFSNATGQISIRGLIETSI